MTDEDEARARLLEHYLAKISARKAELARAGCELDASGDVKRKARSTKLTNDIADLAEKIDRLRERISSV